MDRRRAIAIALVAVLIATLFAVVPTPARAAPASPSSAPRPAATVYVAAVSAPGCGEFSPNLDCSHVYFSAYDPSDAQARVTITDQNYTRDSIPAVAASWNATFTTGPYNDSINWNGFYYLPLSLSLGGLWNISIHGSLGGWYNASFLVTTYYAYMETTHGAYLPRHTGTALYYVDQTVNDAPRAGISGITLTAEYYTNTATWMPLPGSPMSLGTSAWGNFSFVVPSDASTFGYIDFTLWVNISAGQYPNSVEGYGSAALGYVSSPQVTLETCLQTGCQGHIFTNGTPVYVATQTWIISPDGSFPAIGLTTTFEFDAGVTPVTPHGSWPSSVATNDTGGAAILFLATNDIFPATSTASVSVSVTDPLNAGQTYGPTVDDFVVQAIAAGTAAFHLSLDSAQYYGGDTATASWQLGAFDPTLSQGWTIDAWWAYEDASGVLSSSGTLNATTTTGHFNVAVPMGYAGEMSVEAIAHNATGSLVADAYAYVTAPSILLNPNEASYLPGDTVTVSVTTLGSVYSNATLFASVVDSAGNIYVNGPLTSHTITIPVPSVGTPSSVSISIAAQDSKLGIVGTAALSVSEATGLGVNAGVTTASNYADGSFQPGQVIQIHYAFQAYGDAALAKTYDVYVYPYSGFYTSHGSILVQTSSTSGDVSYTIPSGTPAGSQLFEVYVTGAACIRACYGYSLFAVNVQPSPSALQYNLGAGSGLTVGWLVLLVLLLVIAIVLVMMIRRRDRPKVMKPMTPSSPGGSSGGVSPPPAAAGETSSSSANWQESSSKGPENPPLPNPPK